jgi:actin
MSTLTPIVVDNGSGTIKAGFAGDMVPRAVCPCVFAWPRNKGVMVPQKYIYVCEDVRSVLVARSPFQKGVITHREGMENIWRHVFHEELKIGSEEHPSLLTEIDSNTDESREMMVQSMFEIFGAHSLCLANPSVLSLFASGRSTGIVLDSGNQGSRAVPVYEGHYLSNAVFRMDLAGSDVTNYLKEMLPDKEFIKESSLQKLITNAIKEKLAYVALDFEAEMEYAYQYETERSYELPDGELIFVGYERFKAPEILFQPCLVASEQNGVHTLIRDSVMNCDEELRKVLFKNIVLSGGTTKITGFPERLYNELRAITSATFTINVVAPPNREYTCWIGGSIFSSLSTFEQVCISHDEYDEFGPTIVHQKCFYSDYSKHKVKEGLHL